MKLLRAYKDSNLVYEQDLAEFPQTDRFYIDSILLAHLTPNGWDQVKIYDSEQGQEQDYPSE